MKMPVLKTIAFITAILCSFSGLALSDFSYDLCQPVQINQIAYNGRCDINKDSFSSFLNETAQFVIESDPKLTLDVYLRDYFFENSADYFKNFYFPKFETQFESM